MSTEAPRPTPAAPPRRSEVVRPASARWHGRLAAWLIWRLISALTATVRWRVVDHTGLLSPGSRQPLLFAVWHNRLALSLAIHRRIVRGGTGVERRMAAIVSASRDGGMLARVLELAQVIPIRGSSSRRGGPALREFVAAARAGHDIALTPDGPRGPVYSLQSGVIAAAQLTGLPIIPVSYRLSWKKTLKTWDRFQIPLPFTRCEIHFAAPVWVPADADESTRARLRQEVEATLRSITRDD